ncbi:hypothetical protein [Neolewinella antarctica]|uniref:Uncharacterized protein n=1 Tax=Neolewinella antarctica TaxID=442734 RepID=A0ABX0XFH3_9BACT|nr:hypothetical protein [Neolewinella antarctica]NJC28065.1 hypothetical protein [Neolewinella antarctica]
MSEFQREWRIVYPKFGGNLREVRGNQQRSYQGGGEDDGGNNFRENYLR